MGVSDCDDSNSCTDDSCTDQLTCSNVNNDENTCDDGFFCIVSDHCSEGSCVGDQRQVDDEVSCTLDSCDEVNDEIVHIPKDSLCDDELYCNGAEVCHLTEDCKAGTDPDCDDEVSCTVDSCNEETDTIDHSRDDNLCENYGCQVGGCSENGCEFQTNPSCSRPESKIVNNEDEEIEGFEKPLNKDYVLIWIYDLDDEPENIKRMKITSKLLSDSIQEQYFFTEDDSSLIIRLFKLIYFFDWVSFYGAIHNNVNPTPVNKILELKSLMK